MGGGDSLYDKIDKGVRGCKVVLTCVTSKYALSANCRREVSLADALKKPVIPLLLEKMTWPPEGPMSMVFTQLLYINFHTPDVSIQNTWDCPQLEELKGKLQIYVPQIEDTTDPTPPNPESTSKAVMQKPTESTEPTKQKAAVTKADQTAPAPTVQDKNDKIRKEEIPIPVSSENTQQKEDKPEDNRKQTQNQEVPTPRNVTPDADEPKRRAKKSSTCHII